MAHWAELDENNIVLRVTIGDNNDPDEGYQWLIDNLGGRWVQTSYNNNFRGTFAGEGYSYDPIKDVFVAPINLIESDYARGYSEFCGFNIPVGEGVYLPEPFTAEFIELVSKDYKSDITAVDIGAGSSNLSIIFASRVSNAKVYAIEPNPIAYEWTKANSIAFEFEASQIIPLNILAKDAPNIINEQVDVVFSFPPSVASVENNHPLAYAIFGGVDGFDVLKEIIESSSKLLKSNGALYLALTQESIDQLFDDSWEKPEYFAPFMAKIVKK